MYKSIANLIFFIILINGCQNSTNSLKPASSSIKNILDDRYIYNSIYRAIAIKNLDDADNSYIKLKTTYKNSNFTKKAALNLAIVHMQNGEYILANFYLQDYLTQEPSSEFAKFLLVKNQFLLAVKNQRDQSYIDRTINSLKMNKDLVDSSEYKLLLSSMLTRVAIDRVWHNKEIAKEYKRLKKDKAFRIHEKRSKKLGININEIYKQ